MSRSLPLALLLILFSWPLAAFDFGASTASVQAEADLGQGLSAGAGFDQRADQWRSWDEAWTALWLQEEVGTLTYRQGRSRLEGAGAEWLDDGRGLWLLSARWQSETSPWWAEAAFVPAVPGRLFAPVNFEAWARTSGAQGPWTGGAWAAWSRDRTSFERLVQGGLSVAYRGGLTEVAETLDARSNGRWVQTVRVTWADPASGVSFGTGWVADRGRPGGWAWEHTVPLTGVLPVPGTFLKFSTDLELNLTAQDGRATLGTRWDDPAGWFASASMVNLTTFRSPGDALREKGPWGSSSMIKTDHFEAAVGLRL